MQSTTAVKRLAIAAILLAASIDAFACGESLFRVGKGVNYRNYFAPVPGKIIAVAQDEGDLLMVERLIAAGHDVHVVSDPSQISEQLNEHEFDIVLALYEQREVVELEIASSSVTYLPVAQEGTSEAVEARELYANSLETDDSVKRFLKTINRTLKQRQT